MGDSRINIESKKFKEFTEYNDRIQGMFPVIGKQFKELTKMIVKIQKQLDELNDKEDWYES